VIVETVVQDLKHGKEDEGKPLLAHLLCPPAVTQEELLWRLTIEPCASCGPCGSKGVTLFCFKLCLV
jgi:hypothetical protein